MFTADRKKWANLLRQVGSPSLAALDGALIIVLNIKLLADSLLGSG